MAPVEITPSWGLRPREGVAFHWSARAILRDGTIDIVWDRQGIEGEATVRESQALAAWLNTKALPWMRAYAKREDFPRGDEDREVAVSGDGYELRANPRASHGYLYMSAAPCASATHTTPNYHAAPKPRTRRAPARRRRSA